MKSIGRDEELNRVAKRLKDFSDSRESTLYFAIVAPPNGGLSEFLDDVADYGNKIGCQTIRVTIDNPRLPDDLIEPLNRVLKEALSEQTETDSSLNATMELFERVQRLKPNSKFLLVVDVSIALRRLREVGSGTAVTDPLIGRLRALPNYIENFTWPLALVIGCDDSFLGWPEVGDVVDRYAPAVALYADYGLGREAWPLFKKVFEAAKVALDGDFPSICGSGLPAGEFVAVAQAAKRNIDRTLVLDLLRARIHDPSQQQLIAGLSDLWLERLCLKDEILKENPQLGAVVEQRAEGGYVASRDLYAALGLSSPREVVSLADHVRQRLEDRDPDLAKEIGKTLADLLSDSKFQTSGSGWRLKAAPRFSEEHPLGLLDVLLLVSLDGSLDPEQKVDAIAFATEAERSVNGLTRLLLVVSYGTRFETQLRRELLAGLTVENIANPRPCDEEESETRGRFLSIMCMVDLSADQVVAVARFQQDRSHDGDIGDEVSDKLAQHFRAVQRRMPLMQSELIDPNAIGKLITSAGEPVELPTAAGGAITSWLIAEKHEGKKFIWRWRSDQLLQRIVALKIADSLKLSGYFLFTENDWPAIGYALASAYTSDLLIWEDSALKAVNPLPVLKQHVQHWHNRFEEKLANAPANLRDQFAALLQDALSSTSDVDGCEGAIDRLIDLTTQLEEAKEAERAAAVILREKLDAELGKVGKTDDLTPEEAQQVDQLRKANAAEDAISEARGLAATVTLQRDQRQQREARLKPVLRNIENLPTEVREQAKKLLEDPKRTVEEIRAEVEELRVSSSEVRETQPDDKEVIKRVETFANTTEDIGKLAELYRNELVHIVKVEISK